MFIVSGVEVFRYTKLTFKASSCVLVRSVEAAQLTAPPLTSRLFYTVKKKSHKIYGKKMVAVVAGILV